MCQIEGAVARRWGSFASSGLPDTVRLPLTTQLLLAARASVSSPTRASALDATRALCASAASVSFDTEPRLADEAAPALAGTSLPTTITSSEEIEGSSPARFSAGRTDKA